MSPNLVIGIMARVWLVVLQYQYSFGFNGVNPERDKSSNLNSLSRSFGMSACLSVYACACLLLCGAQEAIA